MAHTDTSQEKKRQKFKIRTRLSIPLLLVVIFQVITYSAVLIFGGEFRDIREYAYSTLVEKTANRSSYIHNELKGKPILVQEYSEEVNRMVARIMKERGADLSQLQSDKELSRAIIGSSLNIVINLLRHSLANDAYIILETGNLYGGSAKAALYLRDLDTNSGAGYGDLLMEVGFDYISREQGIARDFGWSAHFMPDPDDTENFDFYYRTIQTARENSHLPANHLGYWSGFSSPTSMIAPSMKYTVPLIAQDGTVYGVLGVGMMESDVLSNIPSNDFLSETACYVLGHSSSDGSYDILTHSGDAYETLLGNAEALYVGERLEEDVYELPMDTGVELLGSVQYLGLYGQENVYANEQWALISVADKGSVMHPVTYLSQMLAVSALASLAVAAVVAVLSCIGFIRPITDAIKLMKTQRQFNEIIHFPPSNIYEIDEMTDAITQLQIDAQAVSSGVSKMISIADVGLGTFMYDLTDDSVFVGQSLINVLKLQLPQGQDIMMSRQEFLDSISNPEVREPVAKGLELARSSEREDYSEIYKINRLTGGTLWIRLGFTYSHHTAIGIVQDITDTMVEKNRIEHERDYDNLTGLLNRQAYYRKVDKLFHNRDELRITAFIMVDLDNLKYVNDTYGHAFGDDYIKTAASVLKKFQEYGGIVSRLSGDEFSACLSGFDRKDEVRELIARVHAELMQSACLLSDGTHYNVSGSLGVSWYPDDGEYRELLMKYADFAMYNVKHSTKGGVAEFDINAYSTDSGNLTGIEEMNRIIDERSVKYAFQSIVSAKTGEIYGYEALMRVQSDMFLSPLELLRTAKVSGKLYEIERLTWMRSLSDFQALTNQGKIEKNARIFIKSIAECDLENPDMQVIDEVYSGLLPQVVLEIPEDENANEIFTSHKKNYLKKRNARIALDDFGTGYNGEYALQSVDPDIIRIDRSVINGCDKDTGKRSAIGNIVSLARERRILVLAEGVETEGELKTAVSCGVDLLQGYYIAQPLFEPRTPAPELANMLRELAERGNET